MGYEESTSELNHDIKMVCVNKYTGEIMYFFKLNSNNKIKICYDKTAIIVDKESFDIIYKNYIEVGEL